MKAPPFQKPFYTTAEFAQWLGAALGAPGAISADVIAVWPFAATKPPASDHLGATVFYSIHAEEWLGRFLTEDEASEAIGISLRGLADLRRSGYGPPPVVLGRGEIERVVGTGSWRRGRDVVIYERAAVDRWLNPPASRGDRR